MSVTHNNSNHAIKLSCAKFYACCWGYVQGRKMEIFEARQDELKLVLDLQYLAYKSEAELYQDFSIPPLTQTLEELKREVLSGVCLVAKERGQIIGSVRAQLVDRVCKIGKLIVCPAKQGEGNGTLLMQSIENIFPSATEFEVFTGYKSIANIRLYKKLGYRESGEKKLNEKISLLFLSKVNNKSINYAPSAPDS